jgi:hypothetical protein
MAIGASNKRGTQVRNQVVGASANLSLSNGDVVLFDNTVDADGVPDVDDGQNATANTVHRVGVVSCGTTAIPFGGYCQVMTGGIVDAPVTQHASDAVAVGDLLRVDIATADILRFIKAGSGGGLAADSVVASSTGDLHTYALFVRAIAREAGTTGTGEETLSVEIINNPVNFG